MTMKICIFTLALANCFLKIQSPNLDIIIEYMMKNLDNIEAFYCSIPEDISGWMSFFDKDFCEDIPDWVFWEEQYSPLRGYAVFRMGFSVVTRRNCRVLKEIIGNESVLEIICGLGSYTAVLRLLGIQVTAIDEMSQIDYETSEYQGWKKHAWIQDVESLDAVSAIKKNGKYVGFVLMSWPPQNEPFALQALQTMRVENPLCHMIYIGGAASNALKSAS